MGEPTDGVIKLSDLLPKDWFSRALAANPSLEQLSEIIGERTVALGMVCGVQVTSLSVDRVLPETSIVEFSVGEDKTVQQLTLAEFRHRLVGALLAAAEHVMPISSSPTLEQVQQYLGVPFLLLSPVLGIELESLKTTASPPALVVRIEGASEETTVEDFRQLICNRMAQEVAPAATGTGFRVDESLVDAAEAALQSNDPDKVCELLGQWPIPLARLLRITGAQGLPEEQRRAIARGLGVLGEAFAEKGQQDWSQEVLRLAVQWAQGLEYGAFIFARLGALAMRRGDYGQAIGMLRRGLRAGDKRSETLTNLAECYTARKRYVAARVCIAQAAEAGASEDVLARLHAAIPDEVETAYAAFEKSVAASEG